ncbi:MAG: hypothetical protein NW207_06520 [Cytophagales bacterium]|nr:hypothetical protein [Cytophagales bacterium]
MKPSKYKKALEAKSDKETNKLIRGFGFHLAVLTELLRGTEYDTDIQKEPEFQKKY